MFSRYSCDTNGSITDAAVKTKTGSEVVNLLPLTVVAVRWEAGKITPEAESIVFPELQRMQPYIVTSVGVLHLILTCM